MEALVYVIAERLRSGSKLSRFLAHNGSCRKEGFPLLLFYRSLLHGFMT